MSPSHDVRAFGAMLLMMLPTPAAGQGTFHLRPFVSVAEVYESNLFSTATAREEDLITRVTPGLESIYRSPLWTLSGRYAVGLERFAEHAELTSIDARHEGSLGIGYQLTPRMTVSAGAEYLTTRTPGELNTLTGLSFPRARAERIGGRSGLKRQLSPVTTGTLEYAFTRDRLFGGFGADTHAAAAAVSRRLSPRTTVTGRYRANRFGFAGAGAERSLVTSHSLGVGVSHAITSDLSVSLDAGPRATGDAVRPEMSTTIAWSHEPAELSLAYARTQSTAIGLVGPVDTHSLQATAARTFGKTFEVRVGPGAFRSGLGDLHADVYVLGIGIVHRFSNGLALDVAANGAVQRGNLFAGSSGATIPRHSVVVRFVAGPSERKR